MKTKEAVETLIKSLRKDKDFYDTWKANITVCFIEAYYLNKISLSSKDIHTIADSGADKFLHLLIDK
jgi:hypothetical protein